SAGKTPVSKIAGLSTLQSQGRTRVLLPPRFAAAKKCREPFSFSFLKPNWSSRGTVVLGQGGVPTSHSERTRVRLAPPVTSRRPSSNKIVLWKTRSVSISPPFDHIPVWGL